MKRYRIREVYLTNITSHSKTRLTELPRVGSIALVGPNGAGKSSIIEAIYMALTLKSLRSSEYDLIRRGTTSAEIRLILESDEDRIQSIIRLGASGRRRSKDVLLLRNGVKLASSVEQYKREMANLLGIRNVKEYHNLIKLTTLIPQGGLRELAEKMANPKEFRELIEAAIGLPDYKRAVEKLERIELYAGDYAFTIPSISTKDLRRIASSPRYRRISEQIAKIKEKIEEAKSNLDKYKIFKRQHEHELNEIEGKIDVLNNEIERLNKKRLDTIKRLESLKEKLKILEEKKRELEEARIEYKEALEASKKLPVIERIAQLDENVTEMYKLRDQIRELEHRKKELESILRDLETVINRKTDYERYVTLQDEYKKLQNDLIRIAGVKSTLEAELRSLREQKESLDRLMRKLASTLGVTLSGEIASDFELLKDAERKLDEEKSMLEEKLTSLTSEETLLASRIEEANKALEALMSATQPKCPVCGRDLDEHHRSTITRELKEKIKEYSKRLDNIKAEKIKIVNKISTLESLVKVATRLMERITATLEVIEEGKISEKQAKLEEIRKQEVELTRRLEEIDGEIRKLESSVKAYEHARANLRERGIDPADYERIKSDYDELFETLENIKATYKHIIEEILSVTGREELEDAISEIKNAKNLLVELKVKAQRLRELEEKIKRLEEDVLELEEVRNQIVMYEEQLAEVEKELDDKQDELSSILKKRDELSAEKARIEANIENLTKEVKELEAEIGKLNEVKKKMITSVMAGIILLDIQEKLLENTRSSLENAMSEILDKFGLEYHGVTIKDVGKGFEVRVLSRNAPRENNGEHISILSGGEKTALALAYVLALQKILAMNLGFLILDEPTSELDSERRETLMELINTLSSEEIAEQLIIITHHEDVIDKVDKTCRVEKTSGVSRVDCASEELY
ncbi:MAG: SMC family ATPase [Desulfurococcales archaeon]|nr:SMC family ATPase [Desulfurococcales archaeon]